MGKDYYVEAFENIAKQLAGYTRRCSIKEGQLHWRVVSKQDLSHSTLLSEAAHQGIMRLLWKLWRRLLQHLPAWVCMYIVTPMSAMRLRWGITGNICVDAPLISGNLEFKELKQEEMEGGDITVSGSEQLSLFDW